MSSGINRIFFLRTLEAVNKSYLLGIAFDTILISLFLYNGNQC